MNKLSFHPLRVPYPTEVYIGENLLLEIEGFCNKISCRRILITDSALVEMYGNFFAAALKAELLTIPSGEQGKTFATHTAILKELFAKDVAKDTLLIALGGGATTDLVGFIASLYKRGLPLIFIPTTLLGIIDASVGGKTAINTPFGKNLLGTFYHPQAIFADLSTLKTLPQKEWQNGRAEILKMGLIWDASLCSPKGHDNLLSWISRAIQAKIDVVIKDPHDSSLRKILNFGHTIGHALETISGYSLSHGEAVAIGCVAEAHLSCVLGYLSQVEFTHIEQLYASFKLKLPSNYTRGSLVQALSHDKKRALNTTRFVLIDRIGHAIPFDGQYCHPVSNEALIPTLEWLERTYERCTDNQAFEESLPEDENVYINLR